MSNRNFRPSAELSHDGQQLRDYLAAQARDDLAERRALFQAALAGNERAKAKLRERGLVRWWREGKWVIGGKAP